MRTNLPVTQNEILLGEKSLIVSKTDLKGRMTYVNKDFLEISGFAEEELIGEPHNLVRHPDMPVEAFEDLWRDLKAGRPWVGYVKNRCKNGDFYWVEAHAAPIWENGEVVGYMSVRRKPAREAVAACEEAYKQFREGRAGGLQICHGQVVGSGWLARWGRKLADQSISMRLLAATLLSVAAVFGAGQSFMNYQIDQALDRNGEAQLATNVGLIKQLLETRMGSLKQETVQLNHAFDSIFREGLGVEGTEEVPLLKHGRHEILNGNFDDVDRFTQRTGAVATLLVAKGDDFLRLVTSLRKENGERAHGTLLGKEHPALAALRDGKPYVGQTRMYGKDYFTSYTPVLGKNGKTVAATFVGLDVTRELANLKERVNSLKVGDSGYYYVLDASAGKNRGTLLIHPAKEGSNVLASKDNAGREFIREMLDRGRGLMYYPWMNAERGETSPRQKVVIFETLPDVQWLLAGGTYVDEFKDLSRQLALYALAIGVVIVILLVLVIQQIVRRLVVRPLEQEILPAFRALSSGRYDNPLDVAGNDEMGQVRQGIETMQNRLGFEVAETLRQSDEMARIKIALDTVSMPVRIADANGRVIYANQAMLETLRQIETSIRSYAPEFSAERFVGSSIGQLYPDPDAAIRRLAVLTSLIEGTMDIGGRTYRVVTSPVFNQAGERLGSVGEWQDRTDQILVEKEIAAIVQAASTGNLDSRVDPQGKSGFFLVLAQGINGLLDTTQQALQATSEVLSRVAQGDLTRTIEADYAGIFGQLKDDSNATILRLREVVGQIKEATEAIDTAAKEIASGNTDLSARTEEQASSIEETSSSMEELNATVRQNADNARQAQDLSHRSNAEAQRCGDMVKGVVTTMNGIQESSRKIADIIGVIDGIAFQTNILALNAAVEAARAGEQGRGFAVVASEVRNLAKRSATAAKEIKDLIDTSVGKVESGVTLVDQAGRSMDEVVSSFRQLAGLVAEISRASAEQSSGIEQVTQAVGQMDETTQQNAALVEQAAAAAESLEEQARGLVQAVGMFQLAVGAAPLARSLPPPAPVGLPEATLPHKHKLVARKPSPNIEEEWAEF